jgi:hypothetical protein
MRAIHFSVIRKIQSHVSLGTMIPWIVFASSLGCQKNAVDDSSLQANPQGEATIAGDCELNQQIKALVNPRGENKENEANFFAAINALGPRDKGRLSQAVQTLKSAVNKVGCSRDKALCFVEFINDQVKKGLTTLDKIKYGHTLKFREVEGTPLVLVRATGEKPWTDPYQPEQMVLTHYANSYHWVFRQAAGDLHPGFIWAAITDSHPLSLDPYTNICYNSPFSRMCTNKDYKIAMEIFRALVAKGYLVPVYRGSSGSFENYFGLIDIRNLYVVNQQKASQVKKDQALLAQIGQHEKSARLPQTMDKLADLLEKRTQPALVPNSKGKYELTKAVLDKLGIPVPGVSADGWKVYLIDHHRITAAYDLQMAIEVYFSRSFVSIN